MFKFEIDTDSFYLLCQLICLHYLSVHLSCVWIWLRANTGTHQTSSESCPRNFLFKFLVPFGGLGSTYKVQKAHFWSQNIIWLVFLAYDCVDMDVRFWLFLNIYIKCHQKPLTECHRHFFAQKSVQKHCALFQPIQTTWGHFFRHPVQLIGLMQILYFRYL